MVLLHRASPSFLSPLPSSRKPSIVSASSLSLPAFSRTLTYKNPMISISSPGSGRRSLLQPLHCCTSPDSSSTEGNPPSSRIFIKGLSRSTSEGYLAKIFSCFGEVSRVKIITSKTLKESLGLAYIWFACEKDARRAVKEMDGKFVDGRFIAVTMAKPESPSNKQAGRLIEVGIEKKRIRRTGIELRSGNMERDVKFNKDWTDEGLGVNYDDDDT